MASALRRSAFEAVPTASDSTPPHTLTILSWNVLADGLAQTGRWAHCPPALLEWDTRARALLAEVDAAGADVVCLQECNHYDNFWSVEMAKRGYEGAFWAKPGSPAARAGAPPDGCAVFWRSARFTVAAVRGEPFNARCVAVPTKRHEDGAPSPSPAADTGATDEEANGGRAPRPPATASGAALPPPTPPRGVQGCLVVTLRDSLSCRAIVVGCTHLKAKAGTEEEAVRARQAAEAVARVREASSAASSSGASRGAAPPVMLLAGDFNAGPNSAAARAPVAAGLASVWAAEEEGGGGRGGALTPWEWSTFKFRTAGVGGAETAFGQGGAPTTAPKASRGLVDHVFYRGAALAGRWPPLEEAAVPHGLPCDAYPSDHAAVAAVFRL